MTINVKLNSKELMKAAKDIERYGKRLERKTGEFLHALADRGIDVAQMHEGDFTGYIVYSKRRKGNSIKIFAKDSQAIVNTWYINSKSTEVRQMTISPLLMAEFGSGFDADPRGITGVGQGTNSPYGHAFDSDGWYWYQDSPETRSGAQFVKEKNGRWKFHSKGTPPSRPLMNAVLDLINEVETIAYQIFGSE